MNIIRSTIFNIQIRNKSNNYILKCQYLNKVGFVLCEMVGKLVVNNYKYAIISDVTQLITANEYFIFNRDFAG